MEIPDRRQHMLLRDFRVLLSIIFWFWAKPYLEIPEVLVKKVLVKRGNNKRFKVNVLLISPWPGLVRNKTMINLGDSTI